jgi:hypothetical protein
MGCHSDFFGRNRTKRNTCHVGPPSKRALSSRETALKERANLAIIKLRLVVKHNLPPHAGFLPKILKSMLTGEEAILESTQVTLMH